MYPRITNTGFQPASFSIKINYLKPAKKGILKAIGKVLRIGKSVAFATVELTLNDELIAYATGTYAILDNLEK